jgi:peptide/nickel transport system substrate-binding protein
VHFHDGTELTADVFLAAAKRFIATRDFIGLDPRSLKKIDDASVRFQSNSGSALMVDNMSHPSVSIFLPKTDVASRPIGTGPYRLLQYEPQRLIEVERFDRYWGPRPLNSRVVFRFLADPQARLMALQRGELDLISEVVPEMLLGFERDDPRIVLHRSRPIRYVALLCNLRGAAPFEVLADVNLRRALALAIDRQAIARMMYQGHCVAAKGLLPGWMFGLGDEEPQGFPTNPRRAGELLEQSGWRPGPDGIRQKNGRRLRLRLVSAFPNASAVKPVPEMLEQMFRTIGVETEILEVEDDQLYYSGYADRGQGDLFLELAANANADPTFLLRNVFHTQTPWKSYQFNAPGPDVDSLLDNARRESYSQATIASVREAHRRIVDIHIAAIPILLVPTFVLTRPGITLKIYENADWINFGDARQKA